MPWIEPKTDWTSEDFFNTDDLNRIENNTLEVINFLRSIQFDAPDVVAVTDRDIQDVEFLSSINRVESNIEDTRKSFLAPNALGIQPAKTWTVGRRFDYRDANRLENNLKLMRRYAQLAKENIVYCGTFACGEEVLINAMA
ncbi:MAG: hypothetical protein ACOYBE_13285 [Blautia sp.]|jgi:hypothetical protein